MRAVETDRVSLEATAITAQPPVSSRRPTWREFAIAGVCVVFLAVQLALPIAQLIWSPRPARFGWQMFSVAAPPPSFELLAADGSAQPIDIAPYVASLRGDVPVARFLPPHLCAVFPQAVAVRFQAPDTPARTFECSR